MFEHSLIPLVVGNPCEQRSKHPLSRSPFESDNCPVEHNYKGNDRDDDIGDYISSFLPYPLYCIQQRHDQNHLHDYAMAKMDIIIIIIIIIINVIVKDIGRPSQPLR